MSDQNYSRGGRRPSSQPRQQTQYNDDNRGVLFWREEKETEKHPDWTGSVTIAGRTFDIAGWSRKSEKGKDYISISVNKERLS
jgi:hypothetical protein